MIRLASDLVADGQVEIRAGALASTADVTVKGGVAFQSNGNLPSQSQTIDDLTIPRGGVSLNRVVLDVSTLTMQDGQVGMSFGGNLVLHGDLTTIGSLTPALIPIPLETPAPFDWTAARRIR